MPRAEYPEFSPTDVHETLCKLLSLDKFYAWKIEQDETKDIPDFFLSLIPSCFDQFFTKELNPTRKQLGKIKEAYALAEDEIDLRKDEWLFTEFFGDRRTIRFKHLGPI